MGIHYGFEPIPDFYEYLKNKYDQKNNVYIYPYALSSENDSVTFNYVKNAPAYSGIKKRKYDRENPDIEEIIVEARKLDSLDLKHKIDFIKIDVEGAEYEVLCGAKNLIKINQPIVLFEFGKGASDFYKATPEMVFNYFKELNMQIYNLNDFLNGKKSLSLNEFEKIYGDNRDYIFLAITC